MHGLCQELTEEEHQHRCADEPERPPAEHRLQFGVAELTHQPRIAREQQHECQDDREQNPIEHLDADQQTDQRNSRPQRHSGADDDECGKQAVKDRRATEVQPHTLAESERFKPTAKSCAAN